MNNCLLQVHGTKSTDRLPTTNYGAAEYDLEALALKESNDNFKVITTRYPGILTCNVPPSNGTTEQLDEMIVAFAEFQAYQNIKEIYGRNAAESLGLKFSNKGDWLCQVLSDSMYPMMDGRSAGEETVRMALMAKVGKLDPEHISHYNLVEYSVSPLDVYRELILASRAIYGEDNDKNTMQVYFPQDDKVAGFASFANNAANKTENSGKWINFVDAAKSSKDWGYERHYTLQQSVTNYLVERTKEFEKGFVDQLKDNKIDMQEKLNVILAYKKAKTLGILSCKNDNVDKYKEE